MIDLLDSSNKDIKRDACMTVGILGTHDAVAKLQAIYQNDTDEKDKVAAMQGLAYLGDKVSVPIFTQGLWNPNKDIRQGAAEGLARAADPSSLNELQKAVMAEKDGAPKLADEFALAALGQDGALSDLVTELGTKVRPMSRVLLDRTRPQSGLSDQALHLPSEPRREYSQAPLHRADVQRRPIEPGAARSAGA